jgi:hypothetical protein
MGLEVDADVQARLTRSRVEGDKAGGVGRWSNGLAPDCVPDLVPVGTWLAMEDRMPVILVCLLRISPRGSVSLPIATA